MPERPRIMFLCTANSARSQLAEAILRDRAGDEIMACSAGTNPATVHPLAIEVLQEIEVRTDGLRSTSVDEVLADGPVNMTIAVCAVASSTCPFVAGEAVRSWPFDDPAACEGDDDARREAFRTARDQIAAKIDSWLEAGRP